MKVLELSSINPLTSNLIRTVMHFDKVERLQKITDTTGEGVVLDSIALNIIAGVESLRETNKQVYIIDDHVMRILWAYRNNYVHDYAGQLIHRVNANLIQIVHEVNDALRNYMRRNSNIRP